MRDATTKRARSAPLDTPCSLVLTSTDPENPRVVRVRLPESGSLVIGRAEASALRIIDESVSRVHCRIHADGGLRIEDAGSVNGTRVDGQLLTGGQEAPLRASSVVEIGGFVGLVQPALESDPSTATMGPRATGVAWSSVASALVVEAPAVKEAYALLELLGSSDISVLVLGETGTGKDVFAEALHRSSPRRADRPFVRLNCAALPEQLLEAELFGYERGAFTGAVAAKPGLVESADGGTVFLDEVGELPLATQAKLLRVLESGEVLRLGSVRTKRIDVRFVSATNRDIEAAARRHEFRADLFYRLDGVSVTLPPLRERTEEILPLTTHFVTRFAKGGRVPVVTEPARSKLSSHDWPGNIRELRNVVERAILLSRGGPIEPAHIVFSAKLQTEPPPATTPIAEAGGVKAELAALERKRISEVLEQCGGNKTRAAKVLGVSRTTLLARLDEYEIPRGGDKDADKPKGR